VSIDTEAVRALTAEVADLNGRLQKIAEWKYSLTMAFKTGGTLAVAEGEAARRKPPRRSQDAPHPAKRGLRLIIGEAATR
jgi:hypothetical protein